MQTDPLTLIPIPLARAGNALGHYVEVEHSAAFLGEHEAMIVALVAVEHLRFSLVGAVANVVPKSPGSWAEPSAGGLTWCSLGALTHERARPKSDRGACPSETFRAPCRQRVRRAQGGGAIAPPPLRFF